MDLGKLILVLILAIMEILLIIFAISVEIDLTKMERHNRKDNGELPKIGGKHGKKDKPD